MSVSKPNRNKSSAEFITQAREVAVKVGVLVSKMPEKHRRAYGDKLVDSAQKALTYLQIGNGIYISENTTYVEFGYRLAFFEIANGYLYNIPTSFDLCLRILKETQEMSEEKRNKLYKQSVVMNDKITETIKLINGVIRSDRSRFNDYKANSFSLNSKAKALKYVEAQFFTSSLKSLIDKENQIIANYIISKDIDDMWIHEDLLAETKTEILTNIKDNEEKKIESMKDIKTRKLIIPEGTEKDIEDNFRKMSVKVSTNIVRNLTL